MNINRMNVHSYKENKGNVLSGTIPTPALSGRDCDLLKETIQAYIQTGRPVGSRFLSKKSKSRLSAATIRNIMSDLEDAGFLHQPHNSAGRVPTDKGYRFYVDALMEKRRLTESEKERIQTGMEKESGNGLENLMDYTSRLLARLSDNVGIVLAPSLSKIVMQQIHFLKLAPNRVMVVIVGKSGIVQSRIVSTEEEISQEEMDRIGRFLTREFADRTLFAIRKELEQLLLEEHSFYETWWKKMPMLCFRSLQEEEVQHGIYMDGTVRMMNHPEFFDRSRVYALLETFEHRSELIRIVSQCVEEESEGVRVRIGGETGLPGMQNCTLITCPYVYDDCVVGSLSILGPTRIEYGKAVSLVDFVARLFGTMMNHS